MIDQPHQGEAKKKHSSERDDCGFVYPEDIRTNEW